VANSSIKGTLNGKSKYNQIELRMRKEGKVWKAKKKRSNLRFVNCLE
jgi:hypothetical protein